MARKERAKYNGTYRGERLNRVAFPLGGIGAGMFCMEGTGAISHLSVRGKPDVANEPYAYAALCVKGSQSVARVLEGPVPRWKVLGFSEAGNGGGWKTYGLPRFAAASFSARFPFGTTALKDPAVPLAVSLTGWSPFIPGDADDSSLPVAALEYRFRNVSPENADAVFSFNAKNFMAGGKGGDSVGAMRGGFVLSQEATAEDAYLAGRFAAFVDEDDVPVDCAWFRGGWFDGQTMAWRQVESGVPVSRESLTDGPPSPGASLFVPFSLGSGQSRTVTLMLCWHVPVTDMRFGTEPESSCAGGCDCGTAERKETYRPWYAGKFAGIGDVAAYWRGNYRRLRRETKRFSSCFYDTTLPDEVVEAVAANLSILKTPTVLRQQDGRMWNWEGCGEKRGCCAGSCTHVWNYTQAVCHLFPDLERSLRRTEFFESQDGDGHQTFRAALPIRPERKHFHAASDGQLGGIMKVYREWRICGDTGWLGEMWPRVKASMDYCVRTWDPRHTGVLEEPHHNTYDIEFWGPDGMCGSFYLGALAAADRMAKALGEDVPLYRELFAKGKRYIEDRLFDGEYFFQDVKWAGLTAPAPDDPASPDHEKYQPEALELLRKEGPKYQYGRGCLADGVLGAWIAAMCGIDGILDDGKVQSHLLSVFRYNLKPDLSTHANAQRPGFAFGKDGGLVLCTWPRGGKLSLPFPYCDEVWTGYEYQVASHLMLMGKVEEGLEIVRTARDRYDGTDRNPFDEYECGHWYGRALSSYGILQGLTGLRYDGLEKILYLRPRVPGDFRVFLSTATGYGTAGVKDGKPFVEVVSGKIEVRKIAVNGE